MHNGKGIQTMIRYTDHISPEEYLGLRRKAGWTELPAEQAEACTGNIYMIVCAREEGKAVGMARLLWDGGNIAFLSDVIVDPQYQGRGIGTELVGSCIRKLRSDLKPGWKVKMTLSSAKGKEP